jgi:sensor histidine kinase regulating citrate/malate metabolism
VVAVLIDRLLRVLLSGARHTPKQYAPGMSRRPLPFAWQVLALQTGLLVVVLGLGSALIGWLFNRELTEQYGSRALAVAHTLAADPAIAEAAAAEDPDATLPARAEAARLASGALFVVITDRHGIRLAHPNPDRIHEPVSTDPSAVLAGRDLINVERGTLGLSARGKTPLRDRSGAVVGEVSVGFRADEIRGYVWQQLGLAGIVAGCALLLGVAGSALLSRRLKRLTLGLQPYELAELVQERAELESIRTLSNALRASRHEFANRLHVLSGLLQLDHKAEALEYLHAVTAEPVMPVESVDDPYLQAFVAAKTAEAAEMDVRLALADTSWVGTRITAPVEVTTVLGILVDNALEAARRGARRPAWVDLALLSDDDALHISVADSGDGVPAPLAGQLFTPGVTTRDGDGHGLGLALARQAARRLGGDVRLTAPGGDDHGAVFEAHLPNALVTA